MFLLVFLGGWCCSASLCGFVVRINIHRIQKKEQKLWSYNNISNFNIWCWSSQPPAPSFLEINPLSMKTFLEMKLKSSWDTILEISSPFFEHFRDLAPSVNNNWGWKILYTQTNVLGLSSVVFFLPNIKHYKYNVSLKSLWLSMLLFSSLRICEILCLNATQ